MNIILFGPPGSGKGTQGDKLVKDFNLVKVSTGDLLRKEIKTGSNLGKKIKLVIDKGQFISNEIMNNIMEKFLSNKEYFNKLIFDGYPRNLQQVNNLENLLLKSQQKVSCAIVINVDKEIIFKRILGRQTCSKCSLIFNEFFNPATKDNHKCDPSFLKKRSDDNEDTINKRFETYKLETLPVFKYYDDLNLLHQIDGKNDILVIYKEIHQIISSFVA